ncbi:MAG: hypothetical protein H6642_01315 [Caldilineaceae bacterium]|nr:hypothetical protein [Caldilineaceae bacterium]
MLGLSGNVVASVPVNADGTFLFINVEANTNYTVQIGTINEAANVGRPPSMGPSLPSGWHNAGEDCCDDTGGDGFVDGLTSVSVGMSNVNNVNFGINNQFLAVTVAYVSSERNGEQLTIRWQTATESGVAGFNILAETTNGLRELNASLIPSQVIDSVEATDYSVTLLTDVDTFYIEEVRLSGTADRMGPYQVGESYGVRDGSDSGSMTNSIFLPLVR